MKDINKIFEVKADKILETIKQLDNSYSNFYNMFIGSEKIQKWSKENNYDSEFDCENILNLQNPLFFSEYNILLQDPIILMKNKIQCISKEGEDLEFYKINYNVINIFVSIKSLIDVIYTINNIFLNIYKESEKFLNLDKLKDIDTFFKNKNIDHNCDKGEKIILSLSDIRKWLIHPENIHKINNEGKYFLESVDRFSINEEVYGYSFFLRNRDDHKRNFSIKVNIEHLADKINDFLLLVKNILDDIKF